jgi:hypothetical protein
VNEDSACARRWMLGPCIRRSDLKSVHIRAEGGRLRRFYRSRRGARTLKRKTLPRLRADCCVSDLNRGVLLLRVLGCLGVLLVISATRESRHTGCIGTNRPGASERAIDSAGVTPRGAAVLSRRGGSSPSSRPRSTPTRWMPCSRLWAWSSCSVTGGHVDSTGHRIKVIAQPVVRLSVLPMASALAPPASLHPRRTDRRRSEQSKPEGGPQGPRGAVRGFWRTDPSWKTPAATAAGSTL